MKNQNYHKEYYQKHKEEIKEQQRQYYQINRDKIRGRQNKYQKEYYLKTIGNRKKYKKERYRNNWEYNLNIKINSLIRWSLKGNKNDKHWENLVGYTMEDLIRHLQSTIPNGYIWQDFLDGKLQIDHVIPISVWNFTRPEHPDFKRCWALENLQLLPARENIVKQNKLCQAFQPALKLVML